MGIPERLNAIEKALEDNNRRYQNSVASILELVSAVIKTIGPEFHIEVDKTIVATHLEAQKQQDTENQKVLDDLIAQKRAVPIEVLGPDTLVICKQSTKDGNLMGTGRLQVQFEQFIPEVREKMLGKGVGFKYEAPDSNIEVTAIYKFQTPAPEVAAPVVEATAPTTETK